MRFNLKINKINRAKFANLILLGILFFNSTLFFIINPLYRMDLYDNKSYNEKKDSRTYPEELIHSATDFGSAERIINYGTEDYSFNELDILNEDEFHDSVSFDPRDTETRTVSLPEAVWSTNGVCGTTGSVSIPFALLDYDAYVLWVGATNGVHFSKSIPFVHLTFGSFGNFEPEAHGDLTSIRIQYGIWPDFYWDTGLTYYLQLHAIADNGAAESLMIATYPDDEHHYNSEWIITSGPVFDRVKNTPTGSIIGLKTDMWCYWETSPYVWINVDFIRIIYEFQTYDLDYYYKLDYSGFGLDNVEEFNITIGVNDTMEDIDIQLYDFDRDTWNSTGYEIDSTGVVEIPVSINADQYFNATDNIHIKFVKLKHYSIDPSSEYKLKIDYISFDFPVPDPPEVYLTQHIMRISLGWDEPNNYGLLITQYRIYRGTTPGGTKTLIGTSAIGEYEDTDVVADTEYYYVVSAVNSIGEGKNSTEVSGQAFNQPFVDWLNPVEGASVVFPFNRSDETEEWRIFYFDYDFGYVDEVKLIINETDYGSVWNSNSCRIYPFLKGHVTATLEGYNSSIKVAEDTREFEFINIENEIEQMLETNITFIGKKLYLILHDPNGDESYTHFTQSTTLSIGLGYEITHEFKNVLGIDALGELYGVQFGGKEEITYQRTEEEGFDWRFELINTIGLTSNKISTDPDYIGPGYGDLYLGEAWFFRYQLNATLREYSNGSEGLQDPMLYYGIVREAEVLLNDLNAPYNWTIQNPVHNNFSDVEWTGSANTFGGMEKIETLEMSNTVTRSFSFSIKVGSHTFLDGGVIEDTIEISETWKNYMEGSVGQTVENGYFIYDDDATDFLAMDVGLDRKFGTYIFRTHSYESQTSNPLEHNTFDYVPPLISFPDIEYDSNDDGGGPYSDDTPKVTVDIFEEGSISEAILKYSINNGSIWEVIFLTEQPGNLGTWDVNIPAQPENTRVLWYIKAWDATGSNSSRMDVTALPFEYTVKVKPPELPEIPGYSPAIILIVSITMFTGLIFIIKRKHKI